MNFKTLSGITPLVIILLLASCNNKEKIVETPQEKVKLEALKVTSRMVDQLGTFTGTVEAEIVNNIAPQNPMRIKKVYVEVGDHVNAGQKLVEMDAVNLNQTRLQMENDKTEFERVNELYKVGGISKSTWDAKKLAYEISKSTYENLLENTILTSPISGLVTKRNYDNGDMYNGGTPIYIVEQIRPVKLMVNISEVLLTKVKKGMDVEVKLDVYGNEVFPGTITLIHPSIDPDTRTFPVEIQIKNADERILPGMFARITFNYGSENRVMVPDRAIVKQTGSSDRYVYVCKDGVSNYRKVTIGQLIGNEYEVIEGLQSGEVVAISSQNRLNNGTEIEIVKSN
ncbi:efflux RND transporter periplasmic adaptor subunit [Bacteroides sp. 224]|uniref:efflux RND transporter periplasmic adaptor subunit n=1 Tax=Bacteroides sp. 224 TaxID=2302936 RepID=UPI0013D16107|nr:efflux RND transporter periplasmic adaptor subunit [Bacteroides sp. 224]NDV66604.1 efflux RND transporter periplasmic adaptor subunit [Bacteroides sp. 224]